MDDCVELESDPAMVAVAREFVRERLEAWESHEHVDEAVLVASELVTNAMLHARTALTLRVEVRSSPPPSGAASVRIEVFDYNPRLPTLGQLTPEATSGRGLALVAEVATAWGMENRSEGKVVWAELGGPRMEMENDDCVDLSGIDDVAAAFEAIEAASKAEEPPARTLGAARGVGRAAGEAAQGSDAVRAADAPPARTDRARSGEGEPDPGPLAAG